MADGFNGNLPREAEKISMNEAIPDLTIVKKEVLNYYDNEFETTPFAVQYDDSLEDKKPVLLEETKPTCFKNVCTEISENENPDGKLRICNKIILGTKPNTSFVQEDNFDDFMSRAVLNRVSIDANYFEEVVTPNELNVVLQDVQSYLKKSKRFCDTCNILFPEIDAYNNHTIEIHTKKDIASTSQSNKCRTIHSRHKCSICAKYFATSSALKRHLQNIHKCNTNITLKTTNKTDDVNIDHDDEASNKCFHCKNTFETQKSLIEHLYDILQMKRKKTEIVPVLKTILFKCNKCDIHFTSSQVAGDHTEHMEMLINWKCCICNRIFKKEDELSHERQHSVSNNFLVYNSEEIDVTKVLFKCSKCLTHFAESNFLYHFRDCGLEVTKSVQCNVCDLLLDYNLKTLHEPDIHEDPRHYTIIETDVISDNPVKSPVKESQTISKLNRLLRSADNSAKSTVKELQPEIKLNELFSSHGDSVKSPVMESKTESESNESSHSFREVKIVLQKIDSRKLNLQEKLTKNTSNEIMNTLSSDKGVTIKSTEDRKKKMVKKPVQTKFAPIRKQMNKRHSNIELHSPTTEILAQRHNMFVFYYCETCACFISNFRVKTHKEKCCLELPRIICKHCGLPFKNSSIVTHKKYHEKRTDFTLNNFRFYSLRNGKAINPPIPEYPKCVNCSVHFISTSARYNHICGGEPYQTCQQCEVNLSEAAFNVHMALHQYTKDSPARYNTTITSESEKNAFDAENNRHTSVDVDDMPIYDYSSDIDEIVYTCANCSVSIDTYDKVVEHCQNHHCAEVKDIPTEFCVECNLKMDSTCYSNHHYLHQKGNDFKMLKFDSYYFPEENHMWVNHIFKSLPKEKVSDILKKSIYRFECRIKMMIIQQGDPTLTVYKCNQCSCFIEPASVFKHADNSCFKLRRHCCAFCGLPFISSASRIDHERIHERPGITMNSYRIVVFNREEDKQSNRSFRMRKTYVLYKCRNCDVVIDNQKINKYLHECDITHSKECPYCALRLHNEDYEKHVSTHEEFVSFNHSMMKVIVLGADKGHDSRIDKRSKSKFKGAICDYKMLVCNKCEICVSNQACISKHTCRFGKQRSKCQKCGLYFSVGTLKTHTRTHERDPDFLRSNMNIVSFDPCNLDQNKNTTFKDTENCELSDSNSDTSDVVLTGVGTRDEFVEIPKVTAETVIEETAKVYKCPCALHFLNEDSVLRHLGVCRAKAKISKQKCPKCELLFTPNVLFTHLLAHHSNKNRRYKYDIEEIDNTQRSSNMLLQKRNASTNFSSMSTNPPT